jgi:RNA polymerase sigma factor for flagellar operon FliA
LWRRYTKTRGSHLRNQLIETYLPLVDLLAARVRKRLPPHVDADDLKSAGVFGLVRAIENFDPERGVKFETYCKKRVCGAMLDELRRQDWIPRETRDRVEQILAVAKRLRECFGREPTALEMSRAVGIPLDEFMLLAADLELASMLPLDTTPTDDFGDGDEGRRFEPIDLVPEPPDVAHRRDLLHLVDRHLSSRERTIVHSYYHDDQTMKRIGSRLRLSESRVCQMHNRMLNRLKARLHQEALP